MCISMVMAGWVSAGPPGLRMITSGVFTPSFCLPSFELVPMCQSLRECVAQKASPFSSRSLAVWSSTVLTVLAVTQDPTRLCSASSWTLHAVDTVTLSESQCDAVYASLLISHVFLPLPAACVAFDFTALQPPVKAPQLVSLQT